MSETEKKPRPVWKKVLRILLWSVVAFLVIIIGAITVAVNYLKPERLTPLVEKIASDQINGEVKIDRVEISFYHTFPRFELDVQGLRVITGAFRSLPDSVRSSLPVYADSLLSLRRLNGAINIPSLLAGKIHLYNIELQRPEINLVQATPDVWSLDIIKDDKPEEKNDSTVIPEFQFGTFRITDGFPVRYVSIPDSIDASVSLAETTIEGADAPSYRLDISGLTSLSIPDFSLDDLGFGIGGDIRWDPESPLRIELDDFTLRAGQVTTDINTLMDFTKGLRLERFSLSLPPTPFNAMRDLIPSAMRGELEKVDATFTAAAEMALTSPFTLGVDSLPSFTASIDIPGGSAKYDNMRLDLVELTASANVDGNDLDRSTIDLSHLKARGEGMGFLLSGTVTNPISDPHIKGTFKGGLGFARLPKVLLSMLPGKVKGVLKADCDFDLRRSYLDKENFHRIKLTGEASLQGFEADMPALDIYLFTNLTQLKLGTNNSFTRMDVTADSLLTASLLIDTASCRIPGLDVTGKGLRMGVGTKNVATSSDTTLINPIGGRITAERLMLRSSEDSVRVRLRDASVGGALTRYKGDVHKPQMHLNIGARWALYGDRINRASLRDASATVTIHPAAPPKLSTRRQARLDSLRTMNPTLSEDSLRRMEAIMTYERRKARRAAADTTGRELLDVEVDNTVKKLLLLWRADGHLKAGSLRLFTPLLPLRNRVQDLDMTFNSDSVVLTDTRVTLGKSDFNVNGTVSNITRALTSVTGNQPLRADFHLVSDTIDVNQLAGAVFAGAAFAEKDDGVTGIGGSLDDNADETAMQKSVANATSDSISVLVIPSNIQANLDVEARNIVYDNLKLNDFRGVLSLYGGALNLSRMSARTDVGSVGLNALYSAPDRNDVSFAFGLNVKDFHIAEFLHLVPAIDSVMPLLSGISGVINADIAATTGIDRGMNIDIPSLKAAVRISGDSLKVIDDQTFRKIGKWLLFKHKERNFIDSMNVEMIIENSRLELFPFIFNLDRYKLGVMGSNDMAMTLNYHIAVLKSPIPFKFGINVTGNLDKMKIRLGGAKFNEKNMARSISIADTTRINLVNEIGKVFRRGVRNARLKDLSFGNVNNGPVSTPPADEISHSDSLYFIQEGLIAPPDTAVTALPVTKNDKKRKK